MKIVELNLGEKPLFLAPMEDITDASFRYMCKLFGVDMMYTEFVSSDGLIRNSEQCLKKLIINKSERPIGIQIYGNIPEVMIEAAKIAEEAKPDVIDINFGCPVKKIVNRGAGAGFLKNIPLMVETTKKIVQAVKTPITVKTRLGWDDNNKNITEVTEKLQDAGIKAITIHGRTRMQMYKGKADWTLIGKIKENPRIHIPIIGNGDINTPEQAEEAFRKYGVDGIMIGRGAIGRPWIFKTIKHYLNEKTFMPHLSITEIVNLVNIHLKKSVEIKGIPRGIYELRPHLINYFKGLPDFKEIKIKLITSTDFNEIINILSIIKEKYSTYLI